MERSKRLLQRRDSKVVALVVVPVVAVLVVLAVVLAAVVFSAVGEASWHHQAIVVVGFEVLDLHSDPRSKSDDVVIVTNDIFHH